MIIRTALKMDSKRLRAVWIIVVFIFTYMCPLVSWSSYYSVQTTTMEIEQRINMPTYSQKQPTPASKTIFLKEKSNNRPHEDILLQGQRIGTITIISPSNSTNNNDHDILRSDDNQCPNINSPLIVRDSKQSKILVFVGSHDARDDDEGLKLYETLMSTSQHSSLLPGDLFKGPWKETALVLPPFTEKCMHKGIFSPDIIKHNDIYIMFAHTHRYGCRGQPQQPTNVLTSRDLRHWDWVDHPNKSNNTKEPPPSSYFASKDTFYIKVFEYDGKHYAIGKSREDKVGSMVLLYTESLSSAPFQRIRKLARGVRHVSLHRKQDTLYVFFTLIGDMPERILLGTIDLSSPQSQWRMLPGPIILRPTNHNSTLSPSKKGSAPCHPVQELRDPEFIPDDDEDITELKGTLFYTLRGEQAIGASHIYQFDELPTAGPI